MASKSYDQRSETLNEFGDQLLRQLRGGSGGGGGGGGGWSGGSSWGGSRGGYYYGSSNSYNSSSGGMSSIGIIIIVVVFALFAVFYVCVKSSSASSNAKGFEAAVNAERNRGRTSTTATVAKPTQQSQCGIGLTAQNGSVTITSIDSNGLFANKGLEVGMIVKTINNVSMIGKTAAEATQVIKDAIGQVTIVTTGSETTELDRGHPPFQTFSGTFDMSYVDRGKQFRGHVILELKKNGSGEYCVTGTTSDADGTAFIIEGLVTYEGDAWWVDEVQSGNDAGLKVLTTGKFDWSTNKFEGSWRASTGQSGRYSSFESTNVTKTFDSVASAATAPVPVVTAVVATPVSPTPTYTQTPIVTAVAESSSPPVVVATANKGKKDMMVGIGIKAPNGTPTISSIQPDGLFATSALRVGMDVQSINNQSMIGKTAGEATRLIKDAVGEITVVAGWNISVSSPIAVAPIASAPPAESNNEPEVYVPSYR